MYLSSIGLIISLSFFVLCGAEDYSKILVTGGISTDRDNDPKTEILDIRTGQSVECQDFPVERLTDANSALVDGAVMVCGGSDNMKKCKTLNNGSWKDSGLELNFIRYFAASNIVPGVGFWINGGSFHRETSEFYSNNKWNKGPEMVTGITEHCSVQVSDKMTFIVGGGIWVGEEEEFGTKRAWMYNWETQEWSDLALMKVGRLSPACGYDQFNGQVVVAGGDSAGRIVKSTEIYDPKTGLWMEAEDLPHPIGYGKIINMGENGSGGALILVGGSDYKLDFDTIYEYQGQTKSWKLLDAKLKYPKFRYAGTAVPDSFVNGCN